MSYHFTLRFPTEQEALTAAESLALLPDDPDANDDLPELVIINQSAGRLFGQAQLITDVQIPGTYDPETGEELTPPVPVPGAFVNVILNRAILPSALRPYRVPYGSGGVCWAGTEPEPSAWPPAAS